jgi:uncharacterized hydrophobic protein (TIGR00271 family)
VRLRVAPDDLAEVMSRIQSCSGLTQGYVAMLLLSSVICSFGILANSAVTVIGAATIAPLTDPILGVALWMVRGETSRFRRSLLTELTGVIICLAAGTLLSLLFGPYQIDYQQSEIVANIQPTLLDLAIGFSAGLAAAYAAVTPRIGHTVAGVAIAISLVPPLCVSGICLAGGLAGQGTFQEAAGGFLLFFANFVAIELAAGIMFTMAGLSRWNALRQDKQLWRAFVINLLLLALTTWFLQRQLDLMLRERVADKAVRRVVNSELGKISGARLDSLRLRFQNDGALRIDLMARAPEELSIDFAEQLAAQLEKELKHPVDLRIGTSLSSYVTPSGRLFVPVAGAPQPEELLRQQTEEALQEAVSAFSHVELINFREVEGDEGPSRLFVAVRSPYVFTEELVERLQRLTERALSTRTGVTQELALVVRTSLTQDYSAQGRVASTQETMQNQAERTRIALESQAAQILAARVAREPNAALLETRANLIPLPDHGGELLDVEIVVESPTLLPRTTVLAWQEALHQELGHPTRLECSNVLGQRLELPAELDRLALPEVSPTPVRLPSDE